MIKYIIGFIFGFVAFALTQPILPVNWSCQMSFTNQTIKNPAWAKSYWEEIARRISNKKEPS